MLIPVSVERAFGEQSGPADALIKLVDGFFKARDKTWFYTSRKKTLESFAQKVESGRIPNPGALEDYVGAMVVVPMAADIPRALAFIDRFFETEYRRPQSDDQTSKLSSDFQFDDLRLYGHLRQPDGLPPGPVYTLIFEIQVKTFLQHAWAIATHDLVYKFDRVSWARSRVAYQVKAMLDHAELSIAAIEQLEGSNILPQIGDPEADLQRLIDLVKVEWSPGELPQDLRRLSMNLNRLLGGLGLDASQAAGLLEEGKGQYGGVHPSGWTPYQTLVDYASRVYPSALKAVLTAEPSLATSFIVYVTPEVLRRLHLDEAQAPSARV